MVPVIWPEVIILYFIVLFSPVYWQVHKIVQSCNSTVTSVVGLTSPRRAWWATIWGTNAAKIRHTSAPNPNVNTKPNERTISNLIPLTFTISNVLSWHFLDPVIILSIILLTVWTFLFLQMFNFFTNVDLRCVISIHFLFFRTKLHCSSYIAVLLKLIK